MLTQIEKMTLAERIQAMEELWESLSQNKSDVESPSWHDNALGERAAKFKSGKAKLFTVNELKKWI